MKMTFGQLLSAYMQKAKLDLMGLSRFINSDPTAVQSWLKNIGLPMFKVRCAILMKINNVLGNKEEIIIIDGDGFKFTLQPKMAAKYQSEQGRQKYYESARWDKLKQKVFERAGYKCEICGCPGSGDSKEVGLNVHHLLYDDDFGTGKEDLSELICVCSEHHALLHSADNEKKAKSYEGQSDGKYKVLIITKQDGEKKVFMFTDDCSDKQINAYFYKMYGKFKIKPKHEIKRIG